MIMMTMPTTWEQAQAASYQAAQGNIYQNKVNNQTQYTQSPIPFPGVWQGGEQPAIVSPYVDWDEVVWVVSKIDGEGNGYVRAVFSTEKEADLYAANVNCDEYEYMDITPHKLDSEVPVNEPKE